MSKKILSLALAVVMLFSICAVAASAVQGDGSENIKIYMTSDATVGAPAGTVVNVSYYIDLPVDELQMCIGNIAIGYNSAAYKVNSTGTSTANDARVWGEDFANNMKSTAAVTVSNTISNNIVKKFNDNDKAKGWDKALQVGMAYNDGASLSGQTGMPVYDNQHIFTLSFVAQRTLTADDVIGVVEGAYGQSFFKVCWFNGTTTAQLYPAAQVDMTEAAAVAPSAAKAQIYKLSESLKHSNGDGTNTVATFFAFDTDVINPNFNANGTSLFVTGITATVSNGESSLTPDPIRFLYKIDADTYGFRVIVRGVPDNASLTIKPIVTTDGTTYTVDTVNFTVNALQDA